MASLKGPRISFVAYFMIFHVFHVYFMYFTSVFQVFFMYFRHISYILLVFQCISRVFQSERTMYFMPLSYIAKLLT